MEKVQNFDFLIRGRGVRIFRIFPNVNVDFKCFSWTKNKLVLKSFLGNFECLKLYVSFFSTLFFKLISEGWPTVEGHGKTKVCTPLPQLQQGFLCRLFRVLYTCMNPDILQHKTTKSSLSLSAKSIWTCHINWGLEILYMLCTVHNGYPTLPSFWARRVYF